VLGDDGSAEIVEELAADAAGCPCLIEELHDATGSPAGSEGGAGIGQTWKAGEVGEEALVRAAGQGRRSSPG
jgi:hypothetical protein